MSLLNHSAKDTSQLLLYTPFILLYVTLGVIFTYQGHVWGVDAWLSLSFLVAIIMLKDWLYMSNKAFLLLNIPLLMHNAGAFGLYGTSFLTLGFDKYMHFTASAVAAWIVFTFLAHKLHVHEYKNQGDQATTLVILVLAVVTTLGVGIELLEYVGYILFEIEGGVIHPGSGSEGMYKDTLNDILANTLGALVGTATYYFSTYKHKKP